MTGPRIGSPPRDWQTDPAFPPVRGPTARPDRRGRGSEKGGSDPKRRGKRGSPALLMMKALVRLPPTGGFRAENGTYGTGWGARIINSAGEPEKTAMRGGPKRGHRYITLTIGQGGIRTLANEDRRWVGRRGVRRVRWPGLHLAGRLPDAASGPARGIRAWHFHVFMGKVRSPSDRPPRGHVIRTAMPIPGVWNRLRLSIPDPFPLPSPRIDRN